MALPNQMAEVVSHGNAVLHGLQSHLPRGLFSPSKNYLFTVPEAGKNRIIAKSPNEWMEYLVSENAKRFSLVYYLEKRNSEIGEGVSDDWGIEVAYSDRFELWKKDSLSRFGRSSRLTRLMMEQPFKETACILQSVPLPASLTLPLSLITITHRLEKSLEAIQSFCAQHAPGWTYYNFQKLLIGLKEPFIRLPEQRYIFPEKGYSSEAYKTLNAALGTQDILYCQGLPPFMDEKDFPQPDFLKDPQLNKEYGHLSHELRETCPLGIIAATNSFDPEIK